MRAMKLQLGTVALAALNLCLLADTLRAQNPNRPPQSQSHSAPPRAASPPRTAPSYQHPQSSNPNRAPANRNYVPPNPGGNRPQESRPAPPSNFNNGNRPPANEGPRQRPGTGGARPWLDTMRSLSPQQRERVLQNSRAFQSLSPDKQNKIRQQFNQWDHMPPRDRESLRQNENTWAKLTPEQRQHLKNDVMPRWRQMPWDRQQVMKQKLGVLQNMPESARNQRLNDPNFTQGMNPDEKSMLRDLSHTHVGGALEPPNE